jgi:hypothetical protein
MALLIVAKDLVGLGDLLELGFGFGTLVLSDLVGMVLQGSLAGRGMSDNSCKIVRIEGRQRFGRVSGLGLTLR